MSFLTDPVALYASGNAYSRLAPESAQGGVASAVGTLTSAAFVIGGLAFYLELPRTKRIARLLGTRSGRDLMLNSWIFDFDYKRPGPGTHAVAAAMLALYPAWWWLGWDRGLRRR